MDLLDSHGVVSNLSVYSSLFIILDFLSDLGCSIDKNLSCVLTQMITKTI